MVDAGRNLKSEIAQLRKRVRSDLSVRKVVQVKPMASGDTDIRVSHQFPRVPLRLPKAHWGVTSDGARLVPELFAEGEAVGLLNRISTQKDRVRVLYAYRMTGGVLNSEDIYAAVGFHIDASNTVPVVLRAVALRKGDFREASEVLAAVLLEYLVQIDRELWTSLTPQQRVQAAKSEPRPAVVGDDGDVVIDPDPTLLKDWGMRARPAPPCFVVTGACLSYE